MGKVVTSRRLWSLIALTGCVCALAGGFYRYAKTVSNRTEPGYSRRRGNPIPVRTEPVSLQTFDLVIGATATTEPSQVWKVQVPSSESFRATALVVKDVHVVEGDYVTAGKVLFELDDSAFRATMKRRETALEAARATLNRVLAEAAFNKLTRRLELESAEDELATRLSDVSVRKWAFEALVKLFDKGYVAFQDYANAKSSLLLARFAQLDAVRRRTKAQEAIPFGTVRDHEAEVLARQQVEAAELDLAASRRDVERCKITSPIDGYLEQFAVIARSVITLDAPVSVIDRLDPIHVRMDFPQERIDELVAGAAAEVVLDSLPQETFAGTVIRISPEVKTPLRVLPVVIRVENPNRRLKAGISGFARVRVKKKALAVSPLGVVRQTNKSMVFRVEDGKARLREVRTGHLLAPGAMEVLDGLEPGDDVVIFYNFYKQASGLANGDEYHRDGDPVDTDRRRWAGR
jgi:multidrug efflux pump subunit AcrA (membrane-fusion protein)